MSRYKIAPSILSADFGRLAEEVRAAEQAGADWIHVDVMDGHFVPNLTIGPDVTRAIRAATSLPLDVHLMVERADDLIDAFAEAGADTIGVHVEACAHLHRTVQHVHARGRRACVVLNPATPASALDAILPEIEQVLVMTVNPGFGGQTLIESTLPKLAAIRGAIDRSGRDIDLVVDGGVGLDNVERVALHGARVLVMGSAFFGAPDYKRLVDQVRARLAPHEARAPNRSPGP